MTGHLLMILGLVWVVTAGCVFGFGWEARGWLADRQLAAAEVARPVPYQVTRRGWVDFVDYGPAPGAADPAFEAPRQPDAMAMAAAAYQLGQDSMTAAETHREVAAIWAEIEANPERWQS